MEETEAFAERAAWRVAIFQTDVSEEFRIPEDRNSGPSRLTYCEYIPVIIRLDMQHIRKTEPIRQASIYHKYVVYILSSP